MFCTKCGSQLDEKDLFCTSCGALVEKKTGDEGLETKPVATNDFSDFDKQDGFDYSFDDDSVPEEADNGFDNSDVSDSYASDYDASYYQSYSDTVIKTPVEEVASNSEEGSQDEYKQSEYEQIDYSQDYSASYENSQNDYNQGYNTSYENSEGDYNQNYSAPYENNQGEYSQDYSASYESNQGEYNQDYSASYESNQGEYNQDYSASYENNQSEYSQSEYGQSDYNQEYNTSYENTEGDYNQGDYNQNYSAPYENNQGEYSQEYNTSYENSEGNYNQNYSAPYENNQGEYSQEYNTSYENSEGNYNQNYNAPYENNQGEYSQEYNTSYENSEGDYNQNYSAPYENNQGDYNQQYDISYEDGNENANQVADQNIYTDNSEASQPPVMVGNKKYISMDSIPAAIAPAETNPAEEGAAASKAASPLKKNDQKKTVIIISSIIGGIILLIAILVGVLLFTDLGSSLKDAIFGTEEEEIIEPVQTEEEFDEEFNETVEEEVEPEDESVEDENIEDENNEEANATEDNQDEEVEEEIAEIVFGSYPIDAEIPVYVKLVESSDSMLQLINDNSGYTMTLNIYPDNTALTQEHCSDLVKNMLPISEHGNVAILIYDEDETYKDQDSFVQPFLAKYYPNETDNYALLSAINHEDGEMDLSVYVGGDFKNLISNNDDYARFEAEMDQYGSYSKGFLYTLQDWLYDKGFEIYGYDPDHCMYKVIVSQGPLKMREEPSSSAEIVNLLAAGEELPVYGEQDGWLHVSYDSDAGWVKSEYCFVQ